MRTLFAPGCTLKAYKPKSILKIEEFLRETGAVDGVYDACCKSNRRIEEETLVISCCPGCAQMFGTFHNVSTVSLWRVLLDAGFPLPSYCGRKMTIHDACHVRGRNSSEMQDSARSLCEKMDVELVEPDRTRDEAPCCGGCAKGGEARRRMAVRRAESLPVKDVALYCTGCVRSFSATNAHPHHLLDLVFGEKTEGLEMPG